MHRLLLEKRRVYCRKRKGIQKFNDRIMIVLLFVLSYSVKRNINADIFAFIH